MQTTVFLLICPCSVFPVTEQSFSLIPLYSALCCQHPGLLLVLNSSTVISMSSCDMYDSFMLHSCGCFLYCNRSLHTAGTYLGFIGAYAKSLKVSKLSLINSCWVNEVSLTSLVRDLVLKTVPRKALCGGLCDNMIGISLLLTRVLQTPGSTSCCHLEDRENFLRVEENQG